MRESQIIREMSKLYVRWCMPKCVICVGAKSEYTYEWTNVAAEKTYDALQ